MRKLHSESGEDDLNRGINDQINYLGKRRRLQIAVQKDDLKLQRGDADN